jgi:hypothetical protein
MKLKYSFNSKIQKFLSNKTVLNCVAVISFLNIVAFIILNKTVAIIYFILIGLVTSFFSKNMNIVLLVPLILVNLFVVYSRSIMRLFNNREGLENNADAKKGDSGSSSGSASKSNNSTSDKKKSSTSTSSSTNQGLPITPLDHDVDVAPTNNSDDSNNSTGKGDLDESFEVGRGKKNSKGYNIDYASTVEDAYDELNKILGSDGIKRLTSDTQNLMKQQMQLAESMKSMEPMIANMAPLMQQAQGLLGTMGQNGNLGDLSKLAEKFRPSVFNNNVSKD